MTNTGWVILVVIVLIIAGLGWWYYSQPIAPAASPAPTGVTGSVTTAPTTLSSSPMNAAVTYGAGGFSPQKVTVKRGGSVTWTNEGSGTMDVASAAHPTHSVYDGTTRAQHCAAGYSGDKPFDQCTAGNTYTFTFQKTGTWAYHNHNNVGHFGTVEVVE